MAIMWDFRDRHGRLMTIEELLKAMPGVSRAMLYRPTGRLAAVRAAIKQSLVVTVQSGHVTAGGGVDAEDHDDADDE
jgi:hypothetical protein